MYLITLNYYVVKVIFILFINTKLVWQIKVRVPTQLNSVFVTTQLILFTVLTLTNILFVQFPTTPNLQLAILPPVCLGQMVKNGPINMWSEMAGWHIKMVTSPEQELIGKVVASISNWTLPAEKFKLTTPRVLLPNAWNNVPMKGMNVCQSPIFRALPPLTGKTSGLGISTTVIFIKDDAMKTVNSETEIISVRDFLFQVSNFLHVISHAICQYPVKCHQGAIQVTENIRSENRKY